MSRGLLASLVVLDLSDSIAGQFASRLMADHGAWTALVEPPQGSKVRRMPPFRSSSNESLLFWHLNGGKQSIGLDIDDASAWDRLLTLCRDADVIIVGDAALSRKLAEACPHAVVGLVNDFGMDGPYAGWTGSELIFQALSGSMFVTGSPGREPLYGVGHRASYAAGLWLYIGILANLCGRLQHKVQYGAIEVSVHEAAAAMEENFSFRFGYNGYVFPRGGDPGRAVASLPCSDGWAVLFLRSGGSEWQKICNAVGATELIDDARYATWPLIFRNWSTAREELGQHSRHMTMAQLVAACEKADMVIAAVETGLSLRDEAHLAERNYWQSVETESGPQPALGPLFQIPAAPASRNRPPPAIGNVRKPDRERTAPPAAPKAAPQPPLPLSGFSVLDITTAWAGPMSTKILAQLGADVLKVEGPRWFDAWRGLLKPTKREQYPDHDPGAKPYDRCALFNAQNLDKRALVLDIKSDRARDLLRTMVPRIDIVVANLRPGAMARQGLGFEALSKLNPGISLIEMPAVGVGPFAHRIGLGPTMEAMAGITAHIGYAEGRPLGSGLSYLDPTGGLHSASASLTALYHRLVTGTGSYIELAQREGAMQWIGEILLEAMDIGRHRPLAGNAVDNACPHNAFPAQGEEQWIAIAAFTDEQWQALCRILEQPAWLEDVRYRNLASRIANRAELESDIARVTRAWSKVELASQLQKAGVPSAPVVDSKELFHDPHLRARDWFTPLRHPEAGTHDYPGYPLRVGGMRYRPRRASPLFGEHTQELLAEYANVPADEFAELIETGVTSTSPA